MLPIPLPANELLDREFLQVRAKTLEIASALDRIQRAKGSVENDPRLAQIYKGLQALFQTSPDRAEQVQLLFSLPYESGWEDKFGIANK